MMRAGAPFRGMRVVYLAVLVLAPGLAGCSEEPGDRASASALEVPDVDVDPSSQLGAIAGVVVDEAIRPIEGATVRIKGLEGNRTTGADGSFSVTDLAPGVYFVSITAARFLPTQTSTDVRAGEVADVRFLLQADPAPQPFHTTIKHDGFIDTSVPLASYVVDILLVDVANMTLCDCVWRFDSGNATTIVFEMAWESTSDPPTEPADLYYQMYEEDKQGITIQSEYVTSPYVVHLDREALWGNWTYFRVHFGGSSNWANLNQPFTAYATFFYNGEAPEGWSLVAGDT
jgi:hypothetical protein